MDEDNLLQLKCRDCAHNLDLGQHFCQKTGWPIDTNGVACVGVLPNLAVQKRWSFQ